VGATVEALAEKQQLQVIPAPSCHTISLFRVPLLLCMYAKTAIRCHWPWPHAGAAWHYARLRRQRGASWQAPRWHTPAHARKLAEALYIYRCPAPMLHTALERLPRWQRRTLPREGLSLAQGEVPRCDSLTMV